MSKGDVNIKTVLEVKDLKKYYGSIRGVEDVSFKIQEGEIFGFIGPNGAGKSTTIRSIMNVINKTSGSVLINGKEFLKDDVETKSIIGYLPSEIHLYSDFTVKKCFDYHEQFYDKNLKKRRKELVKLFEIDESKKIEDLSLGNLKKVGIVLSLMHEPKILILDEPTSGLDPIMQDRFNKLLLSEKEKGTTILYSTHILSEVSKLCDRVGIIKDGVLIKTEGIEELLEKCLLSVTIKSKDVDKIVKKLNIDAKVIDNMVKFNTNMDPNTLIKELSEYHLEKILIEETPIEDVFLHYYK